MGFISDNGGEEYNLCHCKLPIPVQAVIVRIDISYLTVWSNFEIADMDFWRSPAYTAYVDYLETSGGFYYEVRTSSSSPHVNVHSTRDSLAVG